MAQYILFVYGTLKRTFSNNYLLESAKYLGTGHTKNKFALYVSGIPFVIKNEQVSVIYGELYQVDELTLHRLDKLEGHPGWYCREETEIIPESSDQTITAWLYFYPKATGTLNPSGMY